MALVTVTHRTTYSYREPVQLGEHRIMMSPNPGPDMRVLSARLSIGPDAEVRWERDRFGNSVASAAFGQGRVSELSVVSSFTVLHRPRKARDLRGACRAGLASAPPGSEGAASPLCPDPSGAVGSWVRDVAGSARPGDEFGLMQGLGARIKRDFTYGRRDDYGTQDAAETLRLGKGTCRDFALLMIEAARNLGIPARFVSGYLYDSPPENGGAALAGGMSTHAWAQILLPGAGWVEFDPTNNMIGGENLIRSAVVLMPSQVSPMHGSFYGVPGAFVGMDVCVDVESRPEGVPGRAPGARPGVRMAA